MATMTTTTSAPARTLDSGELERVEAALMAVVRGAMHGSHQFESGVDRAGYITLVSLARRGPLRQTDLACGMNLDLSTVSRQIKSLEELGYVKRVADAADRRASTLSVTAAGRREIARQRDVRWSPVAQRLAQIPAEKRATLLDFLEQLADLTAAAPPPATRTTGKALR